MHDNSFHMCRICYSDMDLAEEEFMSLGVDYGVTWYIHAKCLERIKKLVKLPWRKEG